MYTCSRHSVSWSGDAVSKSHTNSYNTNACANINTRKEKKRKGDKKRGEKKEEKKKKKKKNST